MTVKAGLFGAKTKAIEGAQWSLMEQSWDREFAADRIDPKDTERGIQHNLEYIASGACDSRLAELYAELQRCVRGESAEMEPRVAEATIPAVEARARQLGISL